MQKRTSIFILLAASMLAFASCSKKAEPENLGTRITGKWKKTKFATDDNLNGRIDPFEIASVDANTVNEKTYNKDFTGTETNTNTPTINFTWSTVGDSVVERRPGNSVVTYQVEAVNSSILDLKRGTSLGLAWYEYSKQD